MINFFCQYHPTLFLSELTRRCQNTILLVLATVKDACNKTKADLRNPHCLYFEKNLVTQIFPTHSKFKQQDLLASLTCKKIEKPCKRFQHFEKSLSNYKCQQLQPSQIQLYSSSWFRYGKTLGFVKRSHLKELHMYCVTAGRPLPLLSSVHMEEKYWGERTKTMWWRTKLKKKS